MKNLLNNFKDTLDNMQEDIDSSSGNEKDMLINRKQIVNENVNNLLKDLNVNKDKMGQLLVQKQDLEDTLNENTAQPMSESQQHFENKMYDLQNKRNNFDDRLESGNLNKTRSNSNNSQRASIGHPTYNNDPRYTDYNSLPVPEGYQSSIFDYGNSFLPPEKWYPQAPRAPACVSEKSCPVCPVYTTGSPVDVKEWNHSNDILPPDNIDIDYIQNKLNKR